MALCALMAPAAGVAQTVPDDAQAAKIDDGYRRAPVIGFDPFRNVVLPHWGVVLTTGAIAANNALNLEDVGALNLLRREDRIRLGDVIDALSLVPQGEGFLGSTQLEGGAHLGMGLGRRFTLGLSLAGRTYGSMRMDEAGLALLRDGNGTDTEFSLGDSHGVILTTAEVGVHGLYRSRLMGDPYDGLRVVLGMGGRYVRPGFFAQAKSDIEDGGYLRAGPDSIVANLALEVVSSASLSGDSMSLVDRISRRLRGEDGSGGSMVVDLLGRIEWPTRGAAVEFSLANVGGGIPVAAMERRLDTLAIATTSLDSLRESLDSLAFDVRDSVDVAVTLPRIWRLGVSAWANSVLQIDFWTTGSLSGDVATPLSMDLATTWRFVRHLPLRAGLVLGGGQGVGYSAGFGLESRNVLLRVSGQSLGGLFRRATGVGARLDFGLFF